MIALIDYEMGNLHSVNKAVELCGGNVKITSSIDTILAADKVILPGVGAIGKAKESLQKFGIWEILPALIKQNKPFLGICLGMQMLFDYSEEGDAPVTGLGIIPGAIKRFPGGGDLKVPHIGWNQIQICTQHPVVKDLKENSFVYFVHSYYAEPENKKDTAITCNYGISFTAAVSRGNLFATQFHPEKSQVIGLQIIKNFVRM